MNLTQLKRLIAIGLLGFSGCHENLPAPAAVRQPTKALEKVKIDGLAYVVTAIVAVAVARMKCPDCGGEMTCAGPGKRVLVGGPPLYHNTCNGCGRTDALPACYPLKSEMSEPAVMRSESRP